VQTDTINRKAYIAVFFQATSLFILDRNIGKMGGGGEIRGCVIRNNEMVSKQIRRIYFCRIGVWN
jgi:hypothetical protein